METFDEYRVRSGFRGLGWKLEDCAATAKKYPHSFEVPAPEEESLVKIGHHLRLHFVLTGSTATSKDAPRAERMWVEVCALPNKGILRGHLTNRPGYITSLGLGDVIEFKWAHVAQVYVTQDDPRHKNVRT